MALNSKKVRAIGASLCGLRQPRSGGSRSALNQLHHQAGNVSRIVLQIAVQGDADFPRVATLSAHIYAVCPSLRLNHIGLTCGSRLNRVARDTPGRIGAAVIDTDRLPLHRAVGKDPMYRTQRCIEVRRLTG